MGMFNYFAIAGLLLDVFWRFPTLTYVINVFIFYHNLVYLAPKKIYTTYSRIISNCAILF